MTNSKTVGPNIIHIDEGWKSLGNKSIEWIIKLFSELMRLEQMSHNKKINT